MSWVDITSYPVGLLRFIQCKLRDALHDCFMAVYRNASDAFMAEYEESKARLREERRANGMPPLPEVDVKSPKEQVRLSVGTLGRFQEILELISKGSPDVSVYETEDGVEHMSIGKSTHVGGSARGYAFHQWVALCLQRSFPGVEKYPQEAVYAMARDYYRQKRDILAFRSTNHLVPFTEWVSWLVRLMANRFLDNPKLFDFYLKPSKKMDFGLQAKRYIEDSIAESLLFFVRFDVLLDVRFGKESIADTDLLTGAGAGVGAQTSQQRPSTPPLSARDRDPSLAFGSAAHEHLKQAAAAGGGRAMPQPHPTARTPAAAAGAGDNLEALKRLRDEMRQEHERWLKARDKAMADEAQARMREAVREKEAAMLKRQVQEEQHLRADMERALQQMKHQSDQDRHILSEMKQQSQHETQMLRDKLIRAQQAAAASVAYPVPPSPASLNRSRTSSSNPIPMPAPPPASWKRASGGRRPENKQPDGDDEEPGSDEGSSAASGRKRPPHSSSVREDELAALLHNYRQSSSKHAMQHREFDDEDDDVEEEDDETENIGPWQTRSVVDAEDAAVAAIAERSALSSSQPKTPSSRSDKMASSSATTTQPPPPQPSSAAADKSVSEKPAQKAPSVFDMRFDDVEEFDPMHQSVPAGKKSSERAGAAIVSQPEVAPQSQSGGKKAKPSGDALTDELAQDLSAAQSALVYPDAPRKNPAVAETVASSDSKEGSSDAKKAQSGDKKS